MYDYVICYERLIEADRVLQGVILYRVTDSLLRLEANLFPCCNNCCRCQLFAKDKTLTSE